MSVIITNGVYTRDDVDFVYVPVTRCGSTWLRSVFRHNKFTEHLVIENIQELQEVPELRDKVKLIVLRDPLERLISGMYAPEDFDLDTIYSREKIFTNFPTDIHTCPQVRFLNGVPTDRAIYIKYENTPTWGFEMHDLLRTMVPNYEEGPVKWENWGHGSSPKDLLDIARNDKVIYNNLMEYLKEDQEFFDKVKWHESN